MDLDFEEIQYNPYLRGVYYTILLVPMIVIGAFAGATKSAMDVFDAWIAFNEEHKKYEGEVWN